MPAIRVAALEYRETFSPPTPQNFWKDFSEAGPRDFSTFAQLERAWETGRASRAGRPGAGPLPRTASPERAAVAFRALLGVDRARGRTADEPASHPFERLVPRRDI